MRKFRAMVVNFAFRASPGRCTLHRSKALRAVMSLSCGLFNFLWTRLRTKGRQNQASRQGAERVSLNCAFMMISRRERDRFISVDGWTTPRTFSKRLRHLEKRGIEAGS